MRYRNVKGQRLQRKRCLEAAKSGLNSAKAPLACFALIFAFGCAERGKESAQSTQPLADPAASEAALSDRQALFSEAPDPRTLPDEQKADQPLPGSFDLVELQSPVKSQGSRGVCSIFSTIALMEHLYMKQGAATPDFSEQLLQWSVKQELGRFTKTGGSNASANLQALETYGVVEEEDYPYQTYKWSDADDPECTGEKGQPTRCYTNGEPPEGALSARRWHLPRSRWISNNPRNIKSFMIEHQMGIVVGLDFFYQSWNHRKSELPTNRTYWSEGYVLSPNSEDEKISNEKPAGHSVLIVGWDDDLSVPKVDAEGTEVLDEAGEPILEKGFFLIKNSWGTSGFGIRNRFGAGYGWISMSYVERFGRAVSSKPPEEELHELCDDGFDNNFDGVFDCGDPSCADSASCAPPTPTEIRIEGEAPASIEDLGMLSLPLAVEATGFIRSLALTLEVEHSYRGDLVITLESPSGRRAQIFNGADHPEVKLDERHLLPLFIGEPTEGTWWLHVEDRAPEDSGLIKRWGLELELSEAPPLPLVDIGEALSRWIPDNEPEGISEEFTVSESAPLSALAFELKIDHSYIGDLVITLTHPSGRVLDLVDREGRNETNLQRRFPLDEFEGLSGKGKWRLQVSDHAAQDRGRLLGWRLSAHALIGVEEE
ncbi:MAG: proprotein convertase P-domain-containing protein [Myxococcota bacterium]|nr:proprotein convertase P-domain-containing protein [Myxococcota bacterium]